MSFEWYWHLKLRPILLRLTSLICAVLSLLIVWSEMTYQNVNPILSVIGLLIQMARDRVSYEAIEVKPPNSVLSMPAFKNLPDNSVPLFPPYVWHTL